MMRDMIERMGRSLSLLIGVGRVTSNMDQTRNTPTLQVSLPGKMLRSDLPYLQHYGFASCPVPGSDVVVLFQGGDRSRGVAIATGDQRNRPQDLQPGEVCVYHPKTASRILMKSDGSIQIVPANGQTTLEGTLTVSKDVIAAGVSLVNHLTTDVQKGSDTSGPPQST